MKICGQITQIISKKFGKKYFNLDLKFLGIGIKYYFILFILFYLFLKQFFGIRLNFFFFKNNNKKNLKNLKN